MATLSEIQAAQVAAVTAAYKAKQNRDAAKIAALVALYYQRRVDPQDPGAVDRWLDLMVPRLIQTTDLGARNSAVFFDAIHRIETGKSSSAIPSLGTINEGVSKSLLIVGPYDYMNKMTEIKDKDLSPAQERTLLAEAKQVTATKIAAERRQIAAEALAVLRAGTRRDRVAMARSELANATAALAMIEARATDLVIVAPVSGRILTRQAEPGEFLAPGVPAVTLGETARPYVRVYIPARRIGEVQVGDTASVTVDGTEQSLGTARIVAINTKAEFTPRVALTEQERADLMFGVKLELLGGGATIHPGLWVSVTPVRPRRQP